MMHTFPKMTRRGNSLLFILKIWMNPVTMRYLQADLK